MFYGWWVVLGSVLSNLVHGASFSYGYGAFSVALIAEFGWSRAALGGAMSVARVWQGGVNVLGGHLTDRFGPRWPMLLGTVVAAAGFLLLSQVNSLPMFYLVLVGVIATGFSIGHNVTSFTAVGNWFVRRRGLAMGIAMSGVGISGLLVPVLGWVMDVHGWRAGAIAAGLSVLAIGIVASSLMRHRPEQYGYLPDGGPPAAPVGHRTPTATVEEDFTIGETLRMSSFWMMGMAFALRNVVSTGVTVHLVLVVTDLQVALVAATGFQALLGVISIPGRLGFGWLADRMDKRLVTAGCMSQMAAGLVVLAYAHSTWQIALALVIYAPAYGGGAAVLHAIRGEYFGRRAFGTIAGAMGVLVTLGAATGPLLGGYLRDATGSYRPTLFLFAGLCLLSVVLILLVRRPHRVVGSGGVAG